VLDGFLTVQKAAEFGQKVKALKHVRNAEYLESNLLPIQSDWSPIEFFWKDTRRYDYAV